MNEIWLPTRPLGNHRGENPRYTLTDSRNRIVIAGCSMLHDIFYELAEDVERIVTRPEGDAFLRRCQEKYGLSNVAYLGVNIPGVPTEGGVYVTTTYSPDWHARYFSRNYVSIDPIVRHGLQRIVPLDWSEIDMSERPLKEFFGEAHEFGVGRQGLSVPLRGMHGETALFSINAELLDRDWRLFRREYVRDFQLLGSYFHAHVLQREGVDELVPELPGRQIEVLKWAAAGKTDWETAAICGMTERTVRYHLSNAMTALNAVNKLHAVAKAIRLRLI